MKKLVATAIALLLSASSAFALTATYGWEDGNTIIGKYGTVLAYNVTSPVYQGSRSLQLVDNYSGSNTPQAYVAWIKGLQPGDVVTASFWRYDTTPNASPSVRIWGHWNNDPNDVNGYNGSAGGNNSYGSVSGWDKLTMTWTVASGMSGLVVEARTYSDGNDTVWIDLLEVTAPDRAGVSIVTPGGTVSFVPEPGAFAALGTGIVGLAGFISRRRKK